MHHEGSDRDRWFCGTLLWQFQTDNGIHSNPVTYTVAGKQYIAVPTGWGGWVEGFAPGTARRPPRHLACRLCVAMSVA
jgi:hypothetical protein